MDRDWVFMLVVWAIVEFIQFLRKRPYPARMKTGAKWAWVLGTLQMMGRIDSSLLNDRYWWALFVSALITGAGILVVYGLRVLLAKGWTRLRTKPVNT